MRDRDAMDTHIAAREAYIDSSTRSNERLAGVGFILKLACAELMRDLGGDANSRDKFRFSSAHMLLNLI